MIEVSKNSGNYKKLEMSELGPSYWQAEFWYPEINEPASHYLEVGLMHVRAADNIRIHYDGDRDGWVIEQASVFAWDADDEIRDEGWIEVAFIPAWGSKKVGWEDIAGNPMQVDINDL
jgi:hypothetical protein